jgi:thiamine biosynthesis lipoprotein
MKPFQTLRFQAMGCPCEILIDIAGDLPAGRQVGAELLALARQEAQRIEDKYSRYRSGNIVDAINSSRGKPVAVDAETAALLDYAAQCYDLSDGLFDITTGALRRGTDATKTGWSNVLWNNPVLQMPDGFEIDFGGICKEYAADRIVQLLIARHPVSTLVNLGGDIAAAGERVWTVGIEDIKTPGQIARTLGLQRGAIATSGSTKRPGHIFNPRTGQPVTQAPESVTVATKTCTEAGFWSTLAMLQGPNAERFLAEQNLEHWYYRKTAIMISD